mmetsp:Transcript_31683/g.94807  ORF Transcript_31683/g.94807 Transcript_31683/m.94807 type:complete len:130 (-) Transcript_31683:632-1021(-)
MSALLIENYAPHTVRVDASFLHRRTPQISGAERKSMRGQKALFVPMRSFLSSDFSTWCFLIFGNPENVSRTSLKLGLATDDGAKGPIRIELCLLVEEGWKSVLGTLTRLDLRQRKVSGFGRDMRFPTGQ